MKFFLWNLYFLALTQALGLGQAPSVAHPPEQFIVSGKVVSTSDGHGLGQARVLLIDVGARKPASSTQCDNDGRFEMRVPAGKYSLEGAHKGFLAGAYEAHPPFSTAIVTGAGLETTGLILKLNPEAAIAGQIVDDFGDPVRQATVTLYRRLETGVRMLRNVTTDSLGMYEFEPLSPGIYFLSVSAQPWYAVHPSLAKPESVIGVDRRLDVAFPVTYYGGATEAEEAAPLDLRAGERAQADIRLNAVPALHIFYHLDREEHAKGVLNPALHRVGLAGTRVQEISGDAISLGLIEFTGVAPGTYTAELPQGSDQTVSKVVDLARSGEQIDASGASPLGDLALTFELADKSTLSGNFEAVLRDERGAVYRGTRTAEGNVRFEDVPAGRYEVQVSAQERAYSVASMVQNGSVSSGPVLRVPAPSKVSVTVVEGRTDVEGFVKRSGKGVGGSMVVLVPKNPALNTVSFRRDQSDLDGSFRLRAVAPGSYTVVAIEDGWEMDWLKPGVIGRYLKRGQSVTVSAQSSEKIVLGQAVELQGK